MGSRGQNNRARQVAAVGAAVLTATCVACTASTAGEADGVENGSPRTESTSPAEGAVSPAPPDAAPGSYARVDGLCGQLDLSTFEELVPIKGEIVVVGEGRDFFSCRVDFEAPGAGGGRGTMWVEFSYLPHPAVGPREYEGSLRTFTEQAEQVIEFPGAWERAVVGVGNGISDTAATLLLQDGNLVVHIDLSLAGVSANDRAVRAVQGLAGDIVELSRV